MRGPAWRPRATGGWARSKDGLHAIHGSTGSPWCRWGGCSIHHPCPAPVEGRAANGSHGSALGTKREGRQAHHGVQAHQMLEGRLQHPPASFWACRRTWQSPAVVRQAHHGVGGRGCNADHPRPEPVEGRPRPPAVVRQAHHGCRGPISPGSARSAGMTTRVQIHQLSSRNFAKRNIRDRETRTPPRPEPVEGRAASSVHGSTLATRPSRQAGSP